MDRDAASGKPFLMHLMTTSNHTPFTFPDGRIDRHRSRQGAVKYSDYAVGASLKWHAANPGSRTRCSSWWPTTVRRARAAPACRRRTTHPRDRLFARASGAAHRYPARQPDRSGAHGARPAGPARAHALHGTQRAARLSRRRARLHWHLSDAGLSDPRPTGSAAPGRKIENWRLNAQMEIVAPVRQPDPMVARAIGAYQETARRARDGLLQHVNLSDGLRMR